MHFTVPISQRLNKLVRSLQQRKFRDQNNMFLAEGVKLCQELLHSDYETELIVIRDYPSADIVKLAEAFSENMVPVYSAPKTQFDQITNTKTPQGIIAVVCKKENKVIEGKPFIALDAVSDPGNIGTIVRTAEWFGIPQIILGRDCADKYNTKAVRSSMGAIFKSSIISSLDLAGFIKDNFKGYKIYGASLDAKKVLTKLKHNENFGLVFGSEAHGISKEVQKVLTDRFKIEGPGNSESLNVAVAVGISLYHFSS